MHPAQVFARLYEHLTWRAPKPLPPKRSLSWLPTAASCASAQRRASKARGSCDSQAPAADTRGNTASKCRPLGPDAKHSHTAADAAFYATRRCGRPWPLQYPLA